jgi:drug/metabolite transporter (DMT)-like permease
LTETSANHKSLALAVMLVSPLFFATNLVFGRAVVGSVAPFTLAFIRWLLVASILLPALAGQRTVIAGVFSSHRRLVFLLGFLGMWLCGGVVYLGLENTTATNATLIYANLASLHNSD